MSFYNLIRVTAISGVLASSSLLGSCTLSEDSEPDTSGNDGLVLSSITLQSSTVVSVKRDSRNRPVKVTDKLSETIWEYSYDPLTITVKTYDRYDEDGNSQLSEESVYHNIDMNSDGFVTSMDETVTSYFIASGYNPDTMQWESGLKTETEEMHYSMAYDSKGHIAEIWSSDHVRAVYTWQGDLLSEINEFDLDDPIGTNVKVNINSGPADNKQGQWGLWWTGYTMPYLSAFGWLGNAPAKLPARITTYEGGNLEEDWIYGYNLNTAGYIQTEQIRTEDGTFTLIYNYKQ